MKRNDTILTFSIKRFSFLFSITCSKSSVRDGFVLNGAGMKLNSLHSVEWSERWHQHSTLGVWWHSSLGQYSWSMLELEESWRPNVSLPLCRWLTYWGELRLRLLSAAFSSCTRLLLPMSVFK